MMRIALPNGIVTSRQLKVIAEITKKYARSLSDATTRQNIQLHWINIESVPEIVGALTAAGLSPKGACGDVIRNVTGCPLAGLDANEVIDVSPLALEIAAGLREIQTSTTCLASSRYRPRGARSGAHTPRSMTSA